MVTASLISSFPIPSVPKWEVLLTFLIFSYRKAQGQCVVGLQTYYLLSGGSELHLSRHQRAYRMGDQRRFFF
jgi:hypothetical protein